MSAAEALLEIHLKAEHIAYSREVKAIPDRDFRFDFQCWRTKYMAQYGEAFNPTIYILVEVQGGVWLKGKSGHSSGTGITRDCEKLSLAAVHGYRTIVVTPAQIKSGQAIDWIKKALA